MITWRNLQIFVAADPKLKMNIGSVGVFIAVNVLRY